MIRFVDMRAADIVGCRFAFWNTVTDRFVSLHSYAWETWAEFESEFGDGAALGQPLDRFKGLCPPWVFDAPPVEGTCYHCGSARHEPEACTLTVAEATRRAWESGPHGGYIPLERADPIPQWLGHG